MEIIRFNIDSDLEVDKPFRIFFCPFDDSDNYNLDDTTRFTNTRAEPFKIFNSLTCLRTHLLEAHFAESRYIYFERIEAYITDLICYQLSLFQHMNRPIPCLPKGFHVNNSLITGCRVCERILALYEEYLERPNNIMLVNWRMNVTSEHLLEHLCYKPFKCSLCKVNIPATVSKYPKSANRIELVRGHIRESHNVRGLDVQDPSFDFLTDNEFIPELEANHLRQTLVKSGFENTDLLFTDSDGSVIDLF